VSVIQPMSLVRLCRDGCGNVDKKYEQVMRVQAPSAGYRRPVAANDGHDQNAFQRRPIGFEIVKNRFL
jgi:hypothetical protein